MLSHIRQIALTTLLSLTAFVAHAQSGDWVERTPLPTPRQEMPHVLLDGKVYVPGGIDADRNSVQVVEVYDPEAGEWSPTAPIPIPLHHLGAAAANGKLYVVGGYSIGFTPTNRVFEYDPAGDDWIEKSPMPEARGAHVAMTVDGLIYVIGGERGGLALGTNQVYDPVADDWTDRAPMPTPREHLAGAVIDGKIYVVGGRRWENASLNNLPTLEIYDPAMNTWEESLAELDIASGGLAAAALHGQLYAFGGEFFQNGSGVYAMNAEYDPAGDEWRDMTPMPAPRHGMGAVAVGDTIFVIGGGTLAGFATSNVNSGFIPPDPAATSAIDEPSLSAQPIHLNNYPNPFRAGTTLRFSLTQTTEIHLTIHDALGRTVETLMYGTLSMGSHSTTWNASNYSNGIYLARLRMGRFVVTQPLVKY